MTSVKAINNLMTFKIKISFKKAKTNIQYKRSCQLFYKTKSSKCNQFFALFLTRNYVVS